MLLLLLTSRAFRFLEKDLSPDFKQVLLFKILEVFDKIRNIFLIRKITKK